MAANDVDVTVIGWVGTVPKLSSGKGPDPVAYTHFRIGRTRRVRDRATGEWSDAPTDWFMVKTFRGLARNVAECIRQGDPVIAHGRLQMEDWEDSDGQVHTTAVVMADTVGPNLAWGVSRFARTVRDAPRDSDDEDDAEDEQAAAERIREQPVPIGA